jgi:hypothetical protein
MKIFELALCVSILVLPAAALAQQGRTSQDGNSAKRQACDQEARQQTRRANGRSGGGNTETMKMQYRGYFQQCMSQ